jgi:hypothetical protein
LKIVNAHCHNCKYRWNYKSESWEEEEIHRREKTYDDVIFKRGGISQHIVIIQYEKKARVVEAEKKRRLEVENRSKAKVEKKWREEVVSIFEQKKKEEEEKK